MNNKAEREAFEAEHKKLHPQVTIRQQNLIGTYTDQYVDHAAFWFQAGAAYQRSIDKGLVEALEDAVDDYDAWKKDAEVTPNESLLNWVTKAKEALAAYHAAQEVK